MLCQSLHRLAKHLKTPAGLTTKILKYKIYIICKTKFTLHQLKAGLQFVHLAHHQPMVEGFLLDR